MKRTNHHAARRFRLENLEARQMLTGDVVVDVAPSGANSSTTEFRAEDDVQQGSRGAIAEGGGGTSSAWTCQGEQRQTTEVVDVVFRAR